MLPGCGRPSGRNGNRSLSYRQETDRGRSGAADGRDLARRSCKQTPPPRSAAEAMTVASTRVAPRTEPSASPAARQRFSAMFSTRSMARISSRMSIRPCHHSATTTAGTTGNSPRPRIARITWVALDLRRSSAMSIPVSNVNVTPRASAASSALRHATQPRSVPRRRHREVEHRISQRTPRPRQILPRGRPARRAEPRRFPYGGGRRAPSGSLGGRPKLSIP